MWIPRVAVEETTSLTAVCLAPARNISRRDRIVLAAASVEVRVASLLTVRLFRLANCGRWQAHDASMLTSSRRQQKAELRESTLICSEFSRHVASLQHTTFVLMGGQIKFQRPKRVSERGLQIAGLHFSVAVDDAIVHIARGWWSAGAPSPSTCRTQLSM